MVTLEQVKLLETKVVRAIEYVERISRENSQLQGKLDSYQKRIDELEVLIQQFREDQGKIEEGILAALDRLNKFEDAIERSIADVPPPEDRAPRRVEKSEPRAPARSAPVPPVPSRSGPEIEDPREPSDPREPKVPLADELEDEKPGNEETGEGDDYSEDNPASGELDIF
jgi:TolA-binding protein